MRERRPDVERRKAARLRGGSASRDAGVERRRALRTTTEGGDRRREA